MAQVEVAVRSSLVCREIIPADCEPVIALLTKGFAVWRAAPFWRQALQRLAEHTPPKGLPQFGYVLEHAGAIVGVLLLIMSERQEDGDRVLRCNVSSWYVEPEFRLYGTLLVRQALRHRDVTYLNVTPAPHTWPMLEAQGYARYSGGRAVLLPLLSQTARRVRVIAADERLAPGPDLAEGEIDLLRDHARWDCLCLLCLTDAGRVPFVFGLRRRRGILPFAYLIYARSLDDLSAHAGALGRALARRGVAFVVTDATGPVQGIPGWFRSGYPKFFLGRNPPKDFDLAFTERAIFGS